MRENKREKGGGGNKRERGGGVTEREERVNITQRERERVRDKRITYMYISCSLHVQGKTILYRYVCHNYSILFSHIQT